VKHQFHICISEIVVVVALKPVRNENFRSPEYEDSLNYISVAGNNSAENKNDYETECEDVSGWNAAT
jgi:hypothetical protein